MNVARTGLWVGVVSALGVLLLAVSASRRKAPGPISAVHAAVADLDGGASCSSCHGGWFGNMRGACSECHDEIAQQVEQGHGLHGRLDDVLAADCASCHSEHHGASFRLVNPLAFSLAGVRDPSRFDHSLVGFAMDGAHLELACRDCHANAEVDVLPEGEHRFLGLDQDCATCHADPHGGQMQFGCATCHGQASFTDRAVPGHEAWLSLLGAHEAVDCRTCHAAGTPHGLEALQPGARDLARQCGDCHETPHSTTFLAGNAAANGVEPRATCAVCHPLDLPAFTDPGVAITPEQHGHGGFPLTEPHHAVDCASCHPPAASYAERHPGRAPRQCASCHADPHDGQFDVPPNAAICVDCHAATHFDPPAFDRTLHAATALPLDGRHAETDCHDCHTDPGDEGARRFRGTPNRCEQCHADAHAGRFASAAAELAAQPRGTCAACHGTGAFADVDAAAFDHGRWTDFPIHGAHAQIDCEECHPRAEAPDLAGRRFGRIARHGDGAVDCAVCHGDPHEGTFARDGAPGAIDGRTGCERCHDTASFRALPHGFDHGAFTGFALTGAHQKIACVGCHERLLEPDPIGRTWARARGGDCADCHRDPHQGQFERNGRIDCARCHKSTTTFATLSFRHNLDSRFPLGEAHQKVACSGCHHPETIGGVQVVRYRPLPMECIDCHGNEGGGATGRRRRE